MINLSNRNLVSFLGKNPRFLSHISDENATYFDLENQDLKNLVVEIQCNIIIIGKYFLKNNYIETEFCFEFFKQGSFLFPMAMEIENLKTCAATILNNKFKIQSVLGMKKINTVFDFYFENFNFQNYHITEELLSLKDNTL